MIITGKEKSTVKLSIIMPCYNVETTLRRAIDSILYQKVNFEFEIVIVDDASTDTTTSIVKEYMENKDSIKLFQNEENSGNAYSFYVGLSNSKGDYFCVLDGDDYYTISDKLQRQVNFLDSDIQGNYVATATQYMLDLGDENISVADRSNTKEFNYVDFLKQSSGYYHTATYMYRNIFRDNVPEYFKMKLYRGDTPRTTFHLMYSGKKIKVLDFIGSVYSFNNDGIWSHLKETEQFNYQINYLNEHRENINTEFEREAIDNLIKYNEKKLKNAVNETRKYSYISIEECILRIRKFINKFAFAQKDFVLKEVYNSEYFDSLSASLGYIYRLNHPEYIQKIRNNDCICIINGIFNPKGGGIFKEILELVKIYSDKKVFLFVTNMDSLDEDTVQIFRSFCNLEVVIPPKNDNKKLDYFYTKYIEISPYRSYYYCAHNDVYGQVLMQSGICENICLFSFDHGFICGISNPNIDWIIAKRPSDYYMLKKFQDKVLYIPTWEEGARDCDDLHYEPFNEHKELITASGAARYYKVDGKSPYRYIDFILELLIHTHGKHIHYGNIPEEIKSYITERLELAELPYESFIYIEWEENVARSLLLNKVDVFIEPFPVVSYKLTLEVFSIGVPVISYKGYRRMEIMDFTFHGSMTWRNKDEFIRILTSLTKDKLLDLSIETVQYFSKNHKFDLISHHIRENKELCKPTFVEVTDGKINEIMESGKLFEDDLRISVMNVNHNKHDKIGVTKMDEYIADENESLFWAISKSPSYKIGYYLLWIPRTARFVYANTVSNDISNIVKKIKKNEHLGINMEGTSEDRLQNLLSSKTFRLGRGITYPYRKLRQIYRKILNKG